MSMDRHTLLKALYSNKSKGLFASIWITLFFYLVPLMVMAAADRTDLINYILPVSILSGLAFFVVLIIYISKRNNCMRSLKTLEKTGKLGYAEEILSGNYNTNGRICIAPHVLFDSKRKIIIAYDDILWVYKMNEKLVDTNVCTSDGCQYVINLDKATLEEFLMLRPSIIYGFSSENQLAYKTKIEQNGVNNDFLNRVLPKSAVIAVGIVAVAAIGLIGNNLSNKMNNVKYTKGVCTDYSYENEFFDLAFEVPRDWEMVEEDDFDEYIDNSAQDYCEMLAVNEEESCILYVMVEEAASDRITQKEHAELIRTEFVNDIGSGLIPDDEVGSATIAGEKYSVIENSGVIDDVMIHNDIYIRKVKNWVIEISIIYLTESDDDAEDALDTFTKLND